MECGGKLRARHRFGLATETGVAVVLRLIARNGVGTASSPRCGVGVCNGDKAVPALFARRCFAVY